MSEHDRQVLLARSRSGPANAAEQDAQQVLLARSRSGPADFDRNDEHHYYHQHHNHNSGLVFEQSPNRSPAGGKRGGFSSFDSTRFGSRPSRSGGALPPLPSLNFDQLTGGNGTGSSTMEVEQMHRAPWHGAESRYVN